jgi:hypothetical protein
MLTRKEKIDNLQSFIESEHFGIETYKTIYLFNQNAHILGLSIDLYGHLVEKLDAKDFSISLTNDVLVRVKQVIILDVIMKVQILIEASLALIEALSKGYDSVPVILTRYNSKLIYEIIEHIKHKEYEMTKVLGLPNIDSLSVSNEEKEFLASLFSHSSESMYTSLLKIINFYQQFSLIYNKTKHGMIFELGLSHTLDPKVELEPLKFIESMVQAIDKIDEYKMPPGYIHHVPENQKNIDKRYYNSFAVIVFRKELFDMIANTKGILKQIISYICDSHLTYAVNCGQTYLHFTIKDGQIGPRYFSNELSVEDSEYLMNIFKKIVPNMNSDLGQLKTIYEFKSAEIVKSIQDNIVTNIWLSNPLSP